MAHVLQVHTCATAKLLWQGDTHADKTARVTRVVHQRGHAICLGISPFRDASLRQRARLANCVTVNTR